MTSSSPLPSSPNNSLTNDFGNIFFSSHNRHVKCCRFCTNQKHGQGLLSVPIDNVDYELASIAVCDADQKCTGCDFRSHSDRTAALMSVGCQILVLPFLKRLSHVEHALASGRPRAGLYAYRI